LSLSAISVFCLFSHVNSLAMTSILQRAIGLAQGRRG
jgi:hypothetical protein